MPKSKTTLDTFMATLPSEQQAAIKVRTQELLAEIEGLRELREARGRSQEQLAERLGVNQAAVSKMERRADMYISSLRDFVEAMGGELEIVATFPDSGAVRIKRLGSL
jgi:ribosome-binding protein aMBF1 (putative translation factor)